VSKQRFVYAIYIKSTPEAVFHALTDGPTTREYWFHENTSDWKPGSAWEHRRLDGSAADVVGKVLESKPSHRLVMTWALPADKGNPEKYSRVTFELEKVASAVKLTVTHDDLDPDLLAEVGNGWSSVLSSLKTLLETGKSLGNLWQ
jgi:uncharacterized protein YndB with AHSA1/START domain